MDNVTHTLISALVGEALHRSVPASGSALSERARRATAIGVLVVGGNLPDVDVVFTGLAGGRLDYLLHHRGHTHTLVGVLLLALLLFAAVRLLWRWRGVRPAPADVRLLAALAVLAPLLHLGLDFTNSYGIHPFWPVDDRWYYGDAVFIVEPLLWACATPLLFTVRSRVARAAVALALVAGIALSWVSGLVPPSLAALVTLLTAGLALVGRRAPARTALASGVAAWLLVTALFGATGRIADARVDTLATAAFPGARTLDTALSPTPANPLCREVLIAAVEGDRYVVRSGTHALLPAWLTAGRCAQLRLDATPTAPLTAVAAPSTDEMAWAGELSMPRELPATLARDHCAVRALLQFARVPWAAQQEGGWVVGDLRYDREPGPGFAEVTPDTPCPRFAAPWVPPRQDLLDGS